MRPDILIVGQGLAGTLLAWEFERAGIAFAVVDRGHSSAASVAAAGLINPITGRRLVKSWRIDTLLPLARAAYRELEAGLGIALWNEVRVRRFFADEREQRVFAEKQARGDFAPFAGAADSRGFWIEGAARVNLPRLVEATRARWRKQGRLRTEAIDVGAEVGRHDLVIDCSGVEATRLDTLERVPWEFSKGEMLEIAVDGLEPGVVLNRGHWVAPIGEGAAWVGATHEPGVIDLYRTETARLALEASARLLLGRRFEVTGHRAGVRVNLPDRRPVAGRMPDNPRLGILNGLGAKGALVAPMLARQWFNHLTEGVPFDPEIDVARFSGSNSSQASAL